MWLRPHPQLEWRTRRRYLALAIVAFQLTGCNGGGDEGRSSPAPTYSGGTSYYVDPSSGRDSNPGTSRDSPWRTLEPIEDGEFGGGDVIRLRGGERIPGSLRFGPENLRSTSRQSMLTITSYGRGRATVVAPERDDAIAGSNVAGIRVSRLNLLGRNNLELLSGDRRGCREGAAGIVVEARGLSDTLDQGLVIEHVDVQRFCEGIEVASADDGSRISHVRVRSVTTHDNGDAGFFTHDAAMANHSIRDVRVANTRAYRNSDRGGIVLFGVDRGRVTDSVAFQNSTRVEGGVGIWAFDSNRILFARNESYRNGSEQITVDGDGFDFDRGVSNSVMKNNYSHDNGGIGFLVCSCQRWGRFYKVRNITIRDNVSHNDGSSGQPSLYVLGGEPMRDVRVLSNRVTSALGDGPLVAVGASGRNYGDVEFRRNSFVARGGKPLLEVSGRRELADDLSFRDNSWKVQGGRLEAKLHSSEPQTLKELRRALGD